MSTKLPAATQKVAGIPNGMRTATVTAVSGSNVTLSISGGSFSSGVGIITSYVPRVGDVVAVFRQDSSWLILGPTAAVNAWQAMKNLPGGYQNGWVDRGGNLPIGQYRVVADSVQLFGEIVTTTTPTTGQIIVSGLPAPTGEAVMIASMTNTLIRLSVTAAGALTIQGAGTSGFLQFCCAYPLDPRLS